MFLAKFILIIGLIYGQLSESVALYPRESETREVKLLDDLWNFRAIPLDGDQNVGFTDKWFTKPLIQSGEVIPMPVPSSFNDITQSRFLRDYVGWVWYDRTFYAPTDWKDPAQVNFLHIGSAHYESVVYINGVNVVNHTGGHLPFDVDITEHLKYDAENVITIALNNRLTHETVPQGLTTYKNDTQLFPKGFYETTYYFDFFNYAGIHRHVSLYALPKDHINDITVTTDIKDTKTGIISYKVQHSDSAFKVECIVDVFDKKGQKVSADNKGFDGSITIPNAIFWWPYTTDPNPGYLYTLRISLTDNAKTIDVYYQKVGIRTVKVTDKEFLINGKPFYFTGFGKHEDENIRGKGLDLPFIAKDFNLIKWIGANSFRTSHYPYSEELMDMADEQGIVVIDECPAVELIEFNDAVLKQHKQTLTELVKRDKNRPSVVMWSIANEPRSDYKEAEAYFKSGAKHARSLDATRPITAAIDKEYNTDKMAQFLDVLMINRYYGWYSDCGYPQVIEQQLTSNLQNWHKTFNKPIMISEYGADTLAGLHQDPSFVFTEEYESEFMMEYHKAFDKLRADGFFVGEHIWNFADFMTDQKHGQAGTDRVVGNRKGIFTRERQPKAGARVLRCRYWNLALVKSQQHQGISYCPVV